MCAVDEALLWDIPEINTFNRFRQIRNEEKDTEEGGIAWPWSYTWLVYTTNSYLDHTFIQFTLSAFESQLYHLHFCINPI